MIAPRSFAGYLQSKGTTQGFERMRRSGIVLPPFQIEQSAAKAMRIEIEELIGQFEKELMLGSARHGVSIQDASPATEILIANLKARLKELETTDKREGDEKLKVQFSRQLAHAQDEFFKDFFEDASERVKTRLAFALDKDKTFANRLDGIRAGYLDSAIERINGGKSFLRQQFITMLDSWIKGEGEDLAGIEGLFDNIRKEGLNFSKFFARDQFSRFNKALSLASYDEAGAKWIRWVTVQDQRVRKAHRALHGKIFRIDDLPKEYGAYLCRCAFLPIFELTKNMKVTAGDGISLAA